MRSDPQTPTIVQAYRIARTARDAIVEHARRESPRECCGVLLGLERHVSRAVPIRNIADSPTRFEIDPAGHIAARREGRRLGLVVIGFYHSHPRSAPVPSAVDSAELTYPDSLHLIVSLAGPAPRLSAFVWRPGGFMAVPLETLG